MLSFVAYDETLADRIRGALSARAEVSERKMFGGIAFMVAGNMAVDAGADFAASLPAK